MNDVVGARRRGFAATLPAASTGVAFAVCAALLGSDADVQIGLLGSFAAPLAILTVVAAILSGALLYALAQRKGVPSAFPILVGAIPGFAGVATCAVALDRWPESIDADGNLSLAEEVARLATNDAVPLIHAGWLSGALLMGVGLGLALHASRRPAALASLALGAWALFDAARGHVATSALRISFGRASGGDLSPWLEYASSARALELASWAALGVLLALLLGLVQREVRRRSTDRRGLASAALLVAICAALVFAGHALRAETIEQVSLRLRLPWGRGDGFEPLVFSQEIVSGADAAPLLRIDSGQALVLRSGAVVALGDSEFEAAIEEIHSAGEERRRQEEEEARPEREATARVLRGILGSGHGEIRTSPFGSERPVGAGFADWMGRPPRCITFPSPKAVLPIALSGRVGAEEMRVVIDQATASGFDGIEIVSPLLEEEALRGFDSSLPIVALVARRLQKSFFVGIPGDCREAPNSVASGIVGAVPLTTLAFGTGTTFSTDDEALVDIVEQLSLHQRLDPLLALGDDATAQSLVASLESLQERVGAGRQVSVVSFPERLPLVESTTLEPLEPAGGSASPLTVLASVRHSRSDIRGSLSRIAVQRVIRGGRDDLRACYEAGLRRDAELEGMLQIRFVIDGTGAVPLAVLGENALSDAILGECVRRVVMGLRFPEPDGGDIVLVVHRFTFHARDVDSFR